MEKLKKLQNQKTFNLCEIFAQAIIQLKNHPQIRELTYPVVELLNNLFYLNPKIMYYPLLLRLIALKIDIQSQTGLNCSVFSQIQHLMKCPWIRKEFKQMKGQGFDFEIHLRV